MNPIPPKLRAELAADPYYKTCARKDNTCSGRITWEHALRYAGTQINARWTIIPLCWHHHLGSGLNKRVNEILALRRASEKDLDQYPKANFRQLRDYLEKAVGDIIPK